jgi:hypothetical protein
MLFPGGAAIMRSPMAIWAYRADAARTAGAARSATCFAARGSGPGSSPTFAASITTTPTSSPITQAAARLPDRSNDAFGDGLCARSRSTGRPLQRDFENSFPNSLGCYYCYATAICGFQKRITPARRALPLSAMRQDHRVFRGLFG